MRRSLMRFFTELRRRKVIQTAVLYAVSAWVLLQVAELLLEMLEVPPWGLRLVFVLLLIGFPLALLLSWMHQITPAGVTRETDPPVTAEKAPTTIAAATPSVTEEPVPVAVTPTDHSIAVLPFTNMSDDKANEYFADGLSEELLNLLSRIQGLRVVARTSSFSFKGRSVSAAEIARELKVANLLEGSVRKAGSRIRISAQLICAADSSHVWSQSFDRDMSDIFAVQDEIAAAVAGELEIKLLGGAAPKSRQTDPRAYSLYLQGRHYFELQSAQGYEQAIEAIHAAIAIDPGFGPAWAMLGALYWGQANNYLIDYDVGACKAREASEKALALDPDLAEPLSLIAMLDMFENRNVDNVTQRVDRALQLEPHNQRVLARAAHIATWRGRLTDAILCGQQALKWDPLSPNVHAVLGRTYYYAGRLDEAEAMRRRLLTLSPGWLSGYYNLGLILLARNDAPAALALMQQEPSRFWRATGLALAHHALGQRAEADAALAELHGMDPVGMAYQLAQVHAYRGEIDRAFEWLDRAGATHDSGLSNAIVDPLVENLHTDPRWRAILAKYGVGG